MWNIKKTKINLIQGFWVRLVDVRGSKLWQGWRDQKVQTSRCNTSRGDAVHSTATTVNSMSHVPKLLKELSLKNPHHKKKKCACKLLTRPIMVMILQYTQISNHYVIYLSQKCWLCLNKNFLFYFSKSPPFPTFSSGKWLDCLEFHSKCQVLSSTSSTTWLSDSLIIFHVNK